MLRIHIAISTLLAITTFSTTIDAFATGADTSLRADLEHLSQRRIFFGHQSVGVNLLDGIKQLSTTEGVPLHIIEVTSANEVKPSTIGHTFVANNGDPFKKLRSFEQALGAQPTGLDVAMMKFCYIDFTPETDVRALFNRYQTTIDALRTKNPGTTFIHVTVPLTIVQGGFKASLKRMLGHAPYGVLENMRRAEYNTLLRQAYQGRKPVFDLARIESTTPNGVAVAVEWKGNNIPAMDPAYTDDGGHLNSTGKLRAARELVAILAATPVNSAAHGKTR
jgi:hypothetical protein